MEFGPRALGARSIIGDVRSPKMQSVMNLKIKHRESFRPFAPSVLRERVADYFEMDLDSPYMLLVAPVVQGRRILMTEAHESLWGIELLNVLRSDIPAVTHVDYSARIQTVHEATNPRYYRLLKAFEKKTGYGVIGAFPFVFGRKEPRLWGLAAAALLIGPAIVYPRALTPVYHAWMFLGHVPGVDQHKNHPDAPLFPRYYAYGACTSVVGRRYDVPEVRSRCSDVPADLFEPPELAHEEPVLRFDGMGGCP
jgi:Carbamoyltransferase C-terminus